MNPRKLNRKIEMMSSDIDYWKGIALTRHERGDERGGDGAEATRPSPVRPQSSGEAAWIRAGRRDDRFGWRSHDQGHPWNNGDRATRRRTLFHHRNHSNCGCSSSSLPPEWKDGSRNSACRHRPWSCRPRLKFRTARYKECSKSPRNTASSLSCQRNRTRKLP